MRTVQRPHESRPGPLTVAVAAAALIFAPAHAQPPIAPPAQPPAAPPAPPPANISNCLAGSLEDVGTPNPIIQLQNTCATALNWSLCVRHSDSPTPLVATGGVAARGIARYGLIASGRARISFRYNYCGPAPCKAPPVEC